MSVRQKALFQLTSFINSEQSYELEIDPYDITILFIISRYLDMPKEICCIRQIHLAKECRISERELRHRCAALVSKKLLFRYTKGKLYYYELGEAITGVEQF